MDPEREEEMQTVDRNLCPDCIQKLRDAHLTFFEIPSRRMEKDRCDWCGDKRFIRVVRVEYDKRGG